MKENPREMKLKEILEEWYPTFSTHWDKTSNCPCKDCADYRINQALISIEFLYQPKRRLSEEKIYDILDMCIYRRFQQYNKLMSDDDIRELAKALCDPKADIWEEK